MARSINIVALLCLHQICLEGSFGIKFFDLLCKKNLLGSAPNEQQDFQHVQERYRQQLLKELEESDILLTIPLEEHIDQIIRLVDSSANLELTAFSPQSHDLSSRGVQDLRELRVNTKPIEVRKIILCALKEAQLFKSFFDETISFCLGFSGLQLPLENNVARLLIDNKLFSNFDLGHVIYRLLEISDDNKLAICENICVFLINIAQQFEHTTLTEILKYLTDDISKINRQGFSGRTLLFVLADRYFVTSFDEKLFKGLLKKGASVFKLDTQGRTVLHIAAYRKHVSICECLVKTGAKVAARDLKGDTPLHAVISSDDLPIGPLYTRFFTQEPLASVSVLKDEPLNTSIADNSSDSSSDRRRHPSALQESYDAEKICRILLKAKDTNINAANHQGNTALHRAVFMNDTRVTQLLLRKGTNNHHSSFDQLISNERAHTINIDATNILDQTPFHVACIKAHDELISFLISRKVGIFGVDIFGNQPIHYVCSSGANMNLFPSDMSFADANSAGWQPLHYACFFNNRTAVKFLLAKISSLDNLFRKSRKRSISSRKRSKCSRLDVNAALPISRKTPLMIACEMCYEDVCSSLLAVPSLDPDARDQSVGTALNWACEFDHLQICKLLLASKFYRQSPLSRVLLLRRAFQNNSLDLQDLFMATWKKGWNSVDAEGNNSLHHACMQGFEDVVSILLQKFPTGSLGLTAVNKAHRTPYACAQEKGYAHIVTILHKYNVRK